MSDMDREAPVELPNPFEPDWKVLESAEDENPFMNAGVELLKEAAQLGVITAGLVHEKPLARDEAILRALLIRINRLARLMLQDTCIDKGELQLSLSRMLIDSVTTLSRLSGADSELFDAYVGDSLIAEREMLKTIQQMRESREEELPIESRMEKSIKRSAEIAEVDLGRLPSRRQLGWPKAEELAASELGPTAYVAYRAGSNAIHGTWDDLRRNYLKVVSGGFEGAYEPLPPRPQPLFMFALLLPKAALDFLDGIETSEDTSGLSRALQDLQRRAIKADGLHESFLSD